MTVFFFFMHDRRVLNTFSTDWGKTSGGQSTQIKYLSKSTDTYSKILLQ